MYYSVTDFLYNSCGIYVVSVSSRYKIVTVNMYECRTTIREQTLYT
jgi:hypothetical protein